MTLTKTQKNRLFFLFLILIGIFFLLPSGVFAGIELPFQDLTGFTPETPDFSGVNDLGAQQLSGTVLSAITFLKYAIGLLAFIWMVWSGIRMISAGDKEDAAKEASSGVAQSAIALMLVVLVEPIITKSLFGGAATGVAPGEILSSPENIQLAIELGKKEVTAVISWVKALVVFLAVAYLLFSAWRLLQDVGGEEEISKQRTVIMWMGVGLVVIAVNEILIDQVFFGNFIDESLRIETVAEHSIENGLTARDIQEIKLHFYQNPVRGIAEFSAIMKYFLQFLAVITLTVMVYAGFIMVTGFANEEGMEKGKKILTQAGIGFVIILMSYILVNTLTGGGVF